MNRHHIILTCPSGKKYEVSFYLSGNVVNQLEVYYELDSDKWAWVPVTEILSFQECDIKQGVFRYLMKVGAI